MPTKKRLVKEPECEVYWEFQSALWQKPKEGLKIEALR